MKPRKIKRLRSIISDKYYLAQRRDYMRQESIFWWHDWLFSRDENDLKTSDRFLKKAEWYTRKLKWYQ